MICCPGGGAALIKQGSGRPSGPKKGNNMAEVDVERRKSKRMHMDSKLVIKRLDGGADEEVDIEISDVSKTGVGFVCKTPLLIGTVYESYLTIWTKEVLHAFLQIVRIELREDMYYYGASFVGMPEMDAARIETYQTLTENGV